MSNLESLFKRISLDDYVDHSLTGDELIQAQQGMKYL